MENPTTVRFLIEHDNLVDVPYPLIEMMNLTNHEIDNEHRIVKLPSLTLNDLKLILIYCEHHEYKSPQELRKPLKSNNIYECVNDKWDADFINKLDFNQLSDLLNAATYVNCYTLADLCYAQIALYFRTHSIEELKKNFNILDDEFTEEEILEIKNQNDWLMKLSQERIKELDNL